MDLVAKQFSSVDLQYVLFYCVCTSVGSVCVCVCVYSSPTLNIHIQNIMFVCQLSGVAITIDVLCSQLGECCCLLLVN